MLEKTSGCCFCIMEQFLSRLVTIRSTRFPFIWSKNIFLPFKLFIAYPQEKTYHRENHAYLLVHNSLHAYWSNNLACSICQGVECLGQTLVFMWNTRLGERFISIFQGISWGWGRLSGRILGFSWYFLYSEDPESYATWQLVKQLVYTSLLLITTLRFTCGETKICSTIKMSQNIMKMIVGQP